MKGDILTPDAMGTLRSILPDLGLRDRVLIALLAGSGLRRREIIAMDVEHFRPGPAPSLVATRRKKRGLGAPEEVRIPARVADLLTLYLGLRRTGPLILSREGRLSGRHVARIVSRAGNLAGLTIHPHSFRHWQGTAYQHVRKDPMATMRRLGHEDVKTTGQYMDGWGWEDRAAVEAVDALHAGSNVPVQALSAAAPN